MTPTDDDLRDRFTQAAELLESLVEDRSLMAPIDRELRKRLLMAAGRVARPTTEDRRKLDRKQRALKKLKHRVEDHALLNKTMIRALRENPIFKTPRRRRRHAPLPPPLGTLHDARVCYCCQTPFQEVHFFYDQMCQACGDFNYGKRAPHADLSGRTALVTGARVKIGYQAAILMLRAGARVLVLTRFPQDAAQRYAREEDFSAWGERLQIYGVDLRRIGDVEHLCEVILETEDRLDFLINNACQTVRRPPGFYDHLMAGEQGRALSLSERRLLAPTHAEGITAAAYSQVPMLPGDEDRSAFPVGRMDADLQQVDLRRVNSWRLRTHEVPTVELLEVHLVNAVAPFLLNARLKPLMMKVPTRDKHIVNVSAMEGQFYRTFKSERHPHTNMAKASLNMMTRTSALDYIEDGIHMNSVDTGWVTDEDPVEHAARKKEEHNFHPPLDIVDGAARIVDPIFHGIATGEHVWGQFLKDYKPTDW